MAVRQEEVSDLQGFMKVIHDAMAAANTGLWYRGCPVASYELKPSLYRHPKFTTINEFSELEAKSLTRFKQRAIPYLTQTFMKDWEFLFFMQHSGVPTRLLDWTENPFMALYFAIESQGTRPPSGPAPAIEDAAVWMLDPGRWNKHAMRHINVDPEPLDVDQPASKNHAPGTSPRDLVNNPIAIYGSHNSPRIVAQRGVFTVFGKCVDPMEVIFDADGFPAECLVKIVVPGRAILSLQRDLLSTGVTDSVVFPDLEGLARELKRHFGFYL